MKRICLFLLFFVLCFFNGNAQSAKVDFSQKPPNIDSLLPKIAAEKNDSARYYLAMSALTISETNPVEDMHNSEVVGEVVGEYLRSRMEGKECRMSQVDIDREVE